MSPTAGRISEVSRPAQPADQRRHGLVPEVLASVVVGARPVLIVFASRRVSAIRPRDHTTDSKARPPSPSTYNAVLQRQIAAPQGTAASPTPLSLQTKRPALAGTQRPIDLVVRHLRRPIGAVEGPRPETNTRPRLAASPPLRPLSRPTFAVCRITAPTYVVRAVAVSAPRP